MSDNIFGDEEVYVIDSNERIRQRLEEYSMEVARKQAQQKDDLLKRFYDSLEFDEEGKPIIPTDEEGYALVPMDEEGNPLVDFDEEGNLIMPGEGGAESFDSDYPEGEEAPPDMEEVSALAEQMLADAQAQVDQMFADAQEQCDAMFENARQDGRQQGYNDGLAEAQQEFADRHAELEAEHQRLLGELKVMQDEMEGQLVDVICEVVDKTFSVMYSDNKEILLHLIDNALLNIENSKTFLIRVNEKNQAFLQQNKEVLLERVGSDVQLDIIMDPLMDEGGCMIETDGGIFDCGMDVQMTNLIRSIRALSISV